MRALSASRREGLLLAGLLGTNVLLRLLVALRPLEYLDGLTISDDSYLALTIARNIARGLGPLYGLEHTNGFQPLYVFLLSPAFLLFPDNISAPVRWAMGLLIVFDTLTLYLLYRFTQRLCSSSLVPPVIAAAWITSPYVIGMTLNVLETAIAVFFLIASLSYLHNLMQKEEVPHQSYLALGFLLGCAILARIDNTLLALSVVFVTLWRQRQHNPTHLSRSLLSLMLGIGVFVLPWLMYSYAYTGLLYPISGEAVRFNSLSDVNHQPTIDNLYLPMLRRAAALIVKKNWILLVIVAASFLWVLVKRRNMRAFLAAYKPLHPALLFAVLLTAAYAGYIFTPWYFDRYLYPVGCIILLVMAVTLDHVFIGDHQQPHTVRRTAVLLMAAIIALNVTQHSFRELFVSTDTTTRGYMNLGLWARREFPDGTRIGAQQSGALGYFADNLTVINLDGVVNASCFRSLVERRNLDYIRTIGVRYIIGWPVDSAFVAKHSFGFRGHDLERVRRIESFRSGNADWYLWKVRREEQEDAQKR